MPTSETRKIVSKRNHFDSAAEIVDSAFIPDELKHPKLANWLIKYTEHVVRRIQHDFAVAAGRGIEQAAALICDPDFYEHRREVRRKTLKKFHEDENRQKQERLQREQWPTKEQIEQDIHYWDNNLAYHHQQIAKCQEKLKQLHGKLPAADLERSATKSLQ